MAKQRKNYRTPKEKVSVLRRRLLEHVPVPELREELSLRPTAFYPVFLVWIIRMVESTWACRTGSRRAMMAGRKVRSPQGSVPANGRGAILKG